LLADGCGEYWDRSAFFFTVGVHFPRFSRLGVLRDFTDVVTVFLAQLGWFGKRSIGEALLIKAIFGPGQPSLLRGLSEQLFLP